MKKTRLPLLLTLAIIALVLLSGGAGSAQEENLVCPAKLGRYGLSTYKGEIEVDPPSMAYAGYTGTRLAECSYLKEYDDFGRAIDVARITVLWFQDEGSKQIECGHSNTYYDFLPIQSNAVWSETHQALIRSVYLIDPGVEGEFQLIMEDLLSQAEERALPCQAATEETTQAPDEVPEDSEFVPSGPFNQNCTIKEDEFGRDWKKYSDIDDAVSFEVVPLQERSREAQEYYTALQRRADLAVEGFALEADMETDRLMRLELREHKNALVRNIKTNLLKAFWRLAYSTYGTIQSGAGLGDSYSKVFTSTGTIPRLGNALKVVQGLTPQTPSYNATTAKFSDKVKAVGLTAALESLTADSPKDLGLAIFQEATKQAVSAPSPDLTPEEITILSTQHLENRVLDEVLHRSYKVNSERRERVQEIEDEISRLEDASALWESEERERVRLVLEDDCKRQKMRFEEGL